MRPWIVGLTGASGMVYGVRLIQILLESKQKVAVVFSEASRHVVREELGISLKSLHKVSDLQAILGDVSTDSLEVFSAKDFTAPIASGSYPSQGMVIVPCSMGTLGAVASGLSQNLIHRAADCTLKEGRKLIVVPRETPLSAIHLENMLKLSRLGVGMIPAMPGFYSGAKTLDEIIDFMVGKILDQMNIPHALFPRWTGPLQKSLQGYEA